MVRRARRPRGRGEAPPRARRRSVASRRRATPELVVVEQPSPRAVRDRALDPRRPLRVRRAQQEVDARPDRGDDVDDLRGPLGQRRHVERVGDREAPEAELAAHEVVHDLAGERRGQRRVAGERRQRDVRRHDEVRPGVDRRRERDELRARRAARGRASIDRQRRWWLSRSASPRPGKCLTAAATPADRRPARSSPPRRTRPPPGRRRTRGSRGAGSPGWTRGRTTGRVDDVDAHRQRARSRSPARRARPGRVAGRAERHAPRERGGPVAERDELAALLVRRDQQRAPSWPPAVAAACAASSSARTWPACPR